MEPNNSQMKAKKSIKKWTEPLIYVVLVAAFGFFSTIATHTGSEDPVKENDLVTVSIENEFEAILSTVKENKEVSL